jgi:predicted nucleotide-binding protein
MPRGRQPGQKNRNYPPLTLAEALKVPRAIQDQASGMTVSRLTLADLLSTTPTSRVFKDLIAASRFYGLTNGGINADEFSLTKLGEQATGADEVAQNTALKAAVMNVEPYQKFFETFKNKKLPTAGPFNEFLVRDADVPSERAEEAISYITADAETAGLIRAVGGGTWIDLEGAPIPTVEPSEDPDVDAPGAEEEDEDTPLVLRENEANEKLGTDSRQRDAGGPPKKVFIAHGKNRTPLEQLKKALDQFKVKYAVAVDEANRGRPISKKVADLMEIECSSGIFIFTADERFLREKEDGTTEEVWRPSENVVYELGAASILYDNRIVIFKEKGVSFPSDFSDLGYIEFEKDQLVAELGSLFAELVGLDILEVRAKG